MIEGGSVMCGCGKFEVGCRFREDETLHSTVSEIYRLNCQASCFTRVKRASDSSVCLVPCFLLRFPYTNKQMNVRPYYSQC